MVIIRLTAEDERCIQGAATLDELQGMRELIKLRIEQSRTLRAFRQAEKVPDTSDREVGAPFTWKAALPIVEEVLGKQHVVVPPYPDRAWYVRITTTMKQYRMDEAYIRKLAAHARDHMMMPIKFEFLVTQHHRILAGEWDRIDRGRQGRQFQHPSATWMQNALPSE